MEATLSPKRPRFRLKTHQKLLTGALATASMALQGCPKKLTERVVETRVQACPEVQAPKVPASSELRVVAIVTQGAARKAVVAAPGYAAVLAEGDTLGSDGAHINNILADGVQASGADGRSFRLPLVTELALAPAPAAPGLAAPTPPPETPAPPVPGNTSDLELWRRSVLSGINRGYGVPYEAFLASTLAVTNSGGPLLSDAHRALGWTAVPGLDKVRLERLELRDGTLRMDGGAPTAEVVLALKKRLETANPVITEVREAPAAGRNDGLVGFSFVLGTPLITLGDAVASRPTPGSAEASETLRGAAGAVATESDLKGFEDQIRAQATAAGFASVEVARDANVRQDGFIGSVSFTVSAVGKLPAVTELLRAIKPPRGSLGGRPVILDPLVVTKDSLQVTVNVPFATGKADTRDPAPAQVFTPQLMNSRWSAATVVPAAQLRNPF